MRDAREAYRGLPWPGDRPVASLLAHRHLFGQGPSWRAAAPQLPPLGDGVGGVAAVLEGIGVALRRARRFAPVHPAAAVRHRGRPARRPVRVRAPQRGLRCMAICFAWGCSSDFARSPPPGRSDHPDHRLPARMDVDVLDRDLLLALAAMAVERFEQRRLGAGELVRLGRGSRAGPRRSARRSWRGGSIPSRRCGRRSAAPPSCLPARPSADADQRGDGGAQLLVAFLAHPSSSPRAPAPPDWRECCSSGRTASRRWSSARPSGRRDRRRHGRRLVGLAGFFPVIGRCSSCSIPMVARAATASAFRPACHAGQQRECSQAWPVGSVPKRQQRRHGHCSLPPQPRQRPGGERTGVAVQPFGDAAGEGAGLGLGARQPAIELGDARPLVEEGAPVLGRPAVVAGRKQRDHVRLVAGQQVEDGGGRRR